MSELTNWPEDTLKSSLIRALRTAGQNLGVVETPEQKELRQASESVIPEVSEPATKEMWRQAVIGGFSPGHLPAAGAGIIAGKMALKSPILRMGKARAALESGEPADSVWREHGAYKGLEESGPMKWEIPDQKSKLKSESMTERLYGNNTQPNWKASDFKGDLQDLIHHPDFFENYPGLRNVQVEARLGPNESGRGTAWPRGRTTEDTTPYIKADATSPEGLHSLLLHEMQHHVQALEGFDEGANSGAIKTAMAKGLREQGLKIGPGAEEVIRKKAYEKYLANMGEVEARMVQDRLRNSSGFNAMYEPIQNQIDAGYPASRQIPMNKLPGYK